MRPTRLVLGVTTGVGLLAACSTGSSDGHPAQAPPTARVVRNRQGASLPNVAQVTARLITPEDLPTGWSEQPVTGPQPSDTGLCNSGHPIAETERIAVFNGPSPNTEIAENLYGYPSTSAARSAFTYATSHATCTTYRPTNTPLTLTLQPLAFPSQGQQSATWQATITNAQTGITQHGDIILVRTGRYELAVIDRTTTKVNIGLFQATVRKALANLVR